MKRRIRNILYGVGSVIDLEPTIKHRDFSIFVSHTSDQERLKEDVLVIRNDFRKANTEVLDAIKNAG